ncbi:hypothetical protein [Paraburkholderia tropica]|uniref:Uncharacterized protein n=1 Tax=Paraburkholderia tropica TaxID=92647 RepID=A0AAQ1GJ66_9BURK|nr:hypothetical protein [Paraburkholderia tropica]SEK02602.1 hypothetical protein SAMN05216550_113191 [Paraburkholderia tropica]
MIYAIVENGLVVNTVEWDGVSSWQPPSGSAAVQVPTGTYVGIGSTYSNGVFGAPPQPPAGEP